MSVVSADKVVLSNGVVMPRLGFGCAFGNWTDHTPGKFFGFTPELGWKLIPQALQAGYRLLDGALLYNTHQILGISIGQAMARGDLTRDDVFIVSKVFHPKASVGFNHLNSSVDMEYYLTHPEADLKQRILNDIERCLLELNVGYLDLLLAHWPGEHNTTDEVQGQRLRHQVWLAFEEAYTLGRVRAIGVSNFLERHLDALLPLCKVTPMVNQIEVSPYLQQRELVQYCQEKGIVVQAWGPFGSGATGVLTDPVVQAIGQKYGKDGGQVILRWLLQKDMAALPKSSSEKRMQSNLQIFDFQLTDEDMNQINGLDRNVSSVVTAHSIA